MQGDPNLNKLRINEKSQKIQNPQGFQAISRRVSDVRKRVSESGFERARCIESRVLHMREFNTISGCVES